MASVLTEEFQQEIISVHESYKNIFSQLKNSFVTKGEFNLQHAEDSVEKCIKRINGWSKKYKNDPAHLVRGLQRDTIELGHYCLRHKKGIFELLEPKYSRLESGQEEIPLAGRVVLFYNNGLTGKEEEIEIITEDQEVDTYLGTLDLLTDYLGARTDYEWRARFPKTSDELPDERIPVENKKFMTVPVGAISTGYSSLSDWIVAGGILSMWVGVSFDMKNTREIRPEHALMFLGGAVIYHLYERFKR